ncbi:hypothetical protein PDIG_73270 [Penicillium digitatum PHI26]|uniref:Uncharacterized protein n=2 Tax=Penicillium digitatum TaxID=36651 RepID=K9G2J9_PEND2|nr:hypothetical protein PDIP_43750 [Penicillium digitatum Pd1]EKV07466.1 hypothetical protein PDIG_73270 [Penicillium digitatum PHI26]EKV14445.1 hypothetical protein PDIP_43750 [Penicillium digitatum Pd1]
MTHPQLAFLDALHTHPPPFPTQLNVRVGYNARSYIAVDGKLQLQTQLQITAQWRDVHYTLEAWRDWDGMRDSGAKSSISSMLSSSGGEHFLRFCVFSAALLKVIIGIGSVHPIWGFFACRDSLERDGPQFRPLKAHRMSSEQLWMLFVRAATTWMRDGGWALWADYEPRH